MAEKLLTGTEAQKWFWPNKRFATDGFAFSKVMERTKQVWWRLNEVFPRRLWVLTANALRLPCHAHLRPLTLDDLVLDPLHILRCDTRVFR